jgi:asparagine synthase (glutamine-hydrolysing)
MCGICGVVSLRGQGVETSVLARMNDTLVHRGPDSEGLFVDGAVGLAARRLAIIDLAGGDQPIANEDGSITLVQNGEIYNYRDLRRELENGGHRFATRSDTEVLVHLYEEHGLHFVRRLRGMFAIALWDSAKRRLVLARDPFGIKPLYYRVQRDFLSFASELKALLVQPGISREIDLDALEAFLAFSFVPAPLSIFREVRKLEPGSLLIWNQQAGVDIRIERYAKPMPVPADRVRSENEAILADELRSRLRESVRAHLIADVPVGVLLSGGLDSATLAALAAEESAERISTFTIGFEEQGFDERKLARLVARRFDTDHQELVLRPEAAELLPELSATFDEPFADASAIPTYFVSRLAGGHVKVALSGEGGDEFFGGYNYYVGHLLAPRLRPIAGLLRPFIERLPVSSGQASTMEWRAKRFISGIELSPLERHYAWKTVFSPEERAAIIEPDRRGTSDPVTLLRLRHTESEDAEELARLMDLDLSVFLVDDMLVKTDRASMAHSLEVRVPLLDRSVAELALALPSRMNVRGLRKKRLLRRAAEPLVPAEILQGNKRGFSIPLAAWLQRDLEPLTREVLSQENVRRQGFFRPEAVAGLISDHAAGRADQSRKIWALLVFSVWAERYAAG